MKQRLLGFACALAVALGTCFVIATPAQASTPSIEITKIYYNSPGSDTGSNTSLNAEYIRLTNERTYTINLIGWTVRDKAGHTYKFSSNFYLHAGYSVYIHTGKGTNTSSNRYWGLSWYIWNNTGDSAYVRNASGTLIDSCTYSGSGSYTYC
jgi:hypothetical protein